MPTDNLAPLARKLARLGVTADVQSAVLSSVAGTRMCAVGEVVVRQNEAAPQFLALLHGIAARFKLGPDGRRQILAFCIPGDLCTVQVGVAGFMDHGIVAISRCTFALIPRRSIAALLEERSKLALALLRDTVADAAVEREWLFNVGRRNAFARIAHLLCEVHQRLESAGLASAASFDFPVTQGDLADAMGLSTVHVNRSVQALKKAGLAIIGRGRVTVLDRDELMKAAGFDETSLNLESSQAFAPATVGRKSSPPPDART